MATLEDYEFVFEGTDQYNYKELNNVLKGSGLCSVISKVLEERTGNVCYVEREELKAKLSDGSSGVSVSDEYKIYDIPGLDTITFWLKIFSSEVRRGSNEEFNKLKVIVEGNSGRNKTEIDFDIPRAKLTDWFYETMFKLKVKEALEKYNKSLRG